MPWWMFTEDINGRLGCLGFKESQAAAMQEEEKYDGVVHIRNYDTYDRAEAKRYFRGEMVRKIGLEEGYRNIKNGVGDLEEE